MTPGDPQNQRPSTPQRLRTLTGLGITALLVTGFAPWGSASATAAMPASPVSSTTEDMVETNPEDNELLMVMDASGSMSETDHSDTVRIEAAREALHGVVDGLDDELNVGLRIFSANSEATNEAACQDSHLAVEIGSDNREDLRDAIDAYDAVGNKTPIAYALEEAANDLDAEGDRTIVLVSDGQENCDPDPCQVAQTIADRGIDLAIHTVGYNVDDAAREDLECIAQAGNGEYFDADDADTLNNTLQRLSQRAFQPFQLAGEPVEGSEDPADAPLLQPGQYVDTWGEGPKYYRIPRTMEDSSFHVGVSAIHNDTTSFDPLTMALGTDDTEDWNTYRESGSYFTNDELCSQVNLYEGTNDAALRVRSGQVTVFPQDEDDEMQCGTADEFILQLDAIAKDGPNVYVGQPLEFVITEEPAVTNLEELPGRAEGSIGDYQWEPMEASTEDAEELLGGNSFNNAPILEPGTTYASDLYPGESMLYKVPVAWGEHLQTQLVTPPRNEYGPDLTNEPGFRLQIYSPHRGLIQHTTQAQGQEGNYYGLAHATSPQTWQNLTHPVRWANREAPNVGHTDMEFASTAGDYYVLVSQSENVPDPIAVPFELTVDTFGEPEGEPQYGTVEQTAPIEEPTDIASASEPTTPEATPEASDAQRTGLTSTQSMFLGVGVVGLLLLIAGAFILYRVLKSRNNANL